MFTMFTVTRIEQKNPVVKAGDRRKSSVRKHVQIFDKMFRPTRHQLFRLGQDNNILTSIYMETFVFIICFATTSVISSIWQSTKSEICQNR